MKTFQDYLTEAEYLAENPAAGDGFSIEIARDETLIETFVVDVVEDGVVLEADDTVLQILRQAGYLNENSNLPPAEDSTSPINGQKDARRYNFETSPDTDLEEQQAGPVNTGYSGSGRSPDMQMAVDMAKMDAKRQALTKIHGPEFQDKEMPPHTFGKLDIQPDGKGGYKVTAPLTINQQNEAKYQGREVPLGKKMKGDVKKSKVYVRGPKGNVVKVNFGDPNMKIKKSNPKRRKSFRARHNCDNPGPRWKARYWSCRSW